MASSENKTSYNQAISNTTIGDVGNTFTNKSSSKKNFLPRYQVVEVYDDGSVRFVDTFAKFGQSPVVSGVNDIATPSSQGIVLHPMKGEYIDIEWSVDPISFSLNKNAPLPKPSWVSSQGAKNFWNQGWINTSTEPLNNKVFDKSIPGYSLNEGVTTTVNMQQALNGFTI